MTDNLPPNALKSELAIEIDHLAEDMLDAADAIERLTRKYSEEVQAILKAKAQSMKDFAKECDAENQRGVN